MVPQVAIISSATLIFAWQKPGVHSKNPHTMLHKLVVEGACHAVYWFLIRYARRDDAHVNSTLGGKCQRMAHLIGMIR